MPIVLAFAPALVIMVALVRRGPEQFRGPGTWLQAAFYLALAGGAVAAWPIPPS